MKPSTPRSPRAGGARPNLSMKPQRKSTGRSPRAASRVPLALRGIRLLQIRPDGVPAWVPSLLAGLHLHHGRGNGRQAVGLPLPVVLRRRKGSRNREGRGGSPDARGGNRGAARVGPHGAPGLGAVRDAPGLGAGHDAPGVGDGIGDDDDGALPGVGGDGAPGLGDAEKDSFQEYGLVEGRHPFLLDIDRWLGRIDQQDLPGEDGSHLYLPYRIPSEKGECGKERESVTDGEDEKDLAEFNKELAGNYSLMLDTYLEIHGCVAQKWKMKRNLDNVSWKKVQQEICSLSGEPLHPPPLLKRGPHQLDAKKERKMALKEQRKEEKKRRREEYKKKDKGKVKIAVKLTKEVRKKREDKEARKKREDKEARKNREDKEARKKREETEEPKPKQEKRRRK